MKATAQDRLAADLGSSGEWVRKNLRSKSEGLNSLTIPLFDAAGARVKKSGSEYEKDSIKKKQQKKAVKVTKESSSTNVPSTSRRRQREEGEEEERESSGRPPAKKTKPNKPARRSGRRAGN